LDSWRLLTKTLPENTIKVNSDLVWALRMVKDATEIKLMRKAAELTSQGMEAAYEAIKPGVRECEVAGKIEYVMRVAGSGPTAFESIVASGIGSSFPHGGCARRVIQKGDFIVVDIGATFDYYCSDMSRTFVAGKPTEKQQKIYDTVLKAHNKAFETMQAGVPIVEVDSSARKLIEKAGYGECFVHRLGHGVGLEVHEPPSLNSWTMEPLEAGNVVTDEPGIYVPNFGGVRIEDTILINRDKPEKLTVGPYNLTGK
jgi:Xaa-Pro aminopeptidase